jgi:hypothetical protein
VVPARTGRPRVCAGVPPPLEARTIMSVPRPSNRPAPDGAAGTAAPSA